MSEFEQVAARLCSSEAFYGNAGCSSTKPGSSPKWTKARYVPRRPNGSGCHSMTLIVLPTGRIRCDRRGYDRPPTRRSRSDSCERPRMEDTRLRNGTRLRISRRPNDPAFHLRVLSAMGKGNEPEGLEGLASLVTSVPLIGAGTGRRRRFRENALRVPFVGGHERRFANLWLDVSG